MSGQNQGQMGQYDIADTFGLDGIPKGKFAVPGFPESYKSEFIPKADPHYQFREELVSDMVTWWTMRLSGMSSDSLYLWGEPAAGKSSLVEQFFARLNVPVISITGDEDRDIPELISTREIVGGDTLVADGPITLAMRQGAVLLLNEVSYFRAQTLSALNDILERGRVVIPESGELVVAAPTFGVVATDNTNGSVDPTGRFTGTKAQNEAFLDRFTFVEVQPMTAKQEVDLLAVRFPQHDRGLLEKMVELANMVREAHRESKISQTMSLRSVVRLVSWLAAKARRHGDRAIYHAMDRAFAFRLDAGERLAIDAFIQTIFGSTRE